MVHVPSPRRPQRLGWFLANLAGAVVALLVAQAGGSVAQGLPLGAPDPDAQCRAAILAAEAEHGLPAALLGAIAQVESGRPTTEGGLSPWPWSINAAGQGRFFDSKAEAISAVQALQARGVSVIDVGCLQVNLHHHPQAFASLEEAFDPWANARYAGLFLTRLHAASQDWVKAAGHYHSQTPDRAEGYRLRVLAAWPGMGPRLAEQQRLRAMAVAWNATRVPVTGDSGFRSLAQLRRAVAAVRPLPPRLVAARQVRLVQVADTRRR
jgi:hypothetical protein